MQEYDFPRIKLPEPSLFQQTMFYLDKYLYAAFLALLVYLVATSIIKAIKTK
jgi:hypothetical protein